MVELHLSWSPLQLYMVITGVFLAAMVALHYVKRRRYVFIAASVATLATLAGAFDVGTRQVDLNRGKFDATWSKETVDKVQNTRNNTATANKQFEEALNLKEVK